MQALRRNGPRDAMIDWLIAIFSLGFERMERDRKRELDFIPDEDFRFGKRRRKSR